MPTNHGARGLCDLFGRPEVMEFVEDVACSDRLSLLAGAGTSIESGFPDWTTLITRLLRVVAGRRGLSDGDIEDFARWTIGNEGLTAAAAVVETALGDSFEVELHRALYEQQLTPPPGQSALAIGKLVASIGHDACDIATTNYDLVLEAAVKAITGKAAVVAHGPTQRNPNRVLHLHGVLKPRGGILGELILSERDYFLMQEDTAWQQEYFGDRLAGSMCVFVGASLTDPNLLRYLYRLPSNRPHYAIFIRQQDAAMYDEAAPEVIKLREESSEARWSQAGVKPLHADFFSQSAQLLHEVLHRRTTSAARRVYKPLPRRLATWRGRLEKNVLTTRPDEFVEMQHELQQIMHELLAGVRADLADAGHRPGPGERLGMSLWVYDPGSESLTNWASADRVWRDPKTMEPLQVDWRSEFVSVQAFCAGSLVSRSTERYAATRWNHVIGIPLYVEDDRVGRLPVGAVTLGSTVPTPHSALRRGLGKLRRTSLPTVEKLLGELLSPVTVPDRR